MSKVISCLNGACILREVGWGARGTEGKKIFSDDNKITKVDLIRSSSCQRDFGSKAGSPF